MASDSRVELQIRDRVAHLTLDRPDQLNALDPQMLEELLAALSTVASAQVNALVLTGRGRMFSAGVDLNTPFFMEHVEDQSIYAGKRLLDWQHEVIQAIYELPVPTLAALNGHACGGGGLGLAAACDLRYAVAGAQLWMVPGALDVVQDFGLSWLVQQQVGASRALHMALTGYRVSADEAKSWGLVNEVYPDVDELTAAVGSFSERLSAQGPDAARMLKTVVRLGKTSNLREQLQVEAIANGLAFQSEEFQSKKRAYLDRLGGKK